MVAACIRASEQGSPVRVSTTAITSSVNLSESLKLKAHSTFDSFIRRLSTSELCTCVRAAAVRLSQNKQNGANTNNKQADKRTPRRKQQQNTFFWAPQNATSVNQSLLLVRAAGNLYRYIYIPGNNLHLQNRLDTGTGCPSCPGKDLPPASSSRFKSGSVHTQNAP